MQLLGGMSPRVFLREHWQKRPLLVRQAIPGFGGLFGTDGRDRVARPRHRRMPTQVISISPPPRSRTKVRSSTQRRRAPCPALDASCRPESRVPGGWSSSRVLVPHRRADRGFLGATPRGGLSDARRSLRSSFAGTGRGAGRRLAAPRHIRRRAPPRYGTSSTMKTVARAGDRSTPRRATRGRRGPAPLYTFLAQTHKALPVTYFYLAHEGRSPRRSRHLRRPRSPRVHDARGPPAIFAASAKSSAASTPASIADFLGRFLTGPKPHVVFPAPSRPPSREALAARLRGRGRLVLTLPSRGLTRGRRIFLNGEGHSVSAAMRALFGELVRERSVALPVKADAPPALIERWVSSVTAACGASSRISTAVHWRP